MSGLDIDHIADLKARNARLADALIECVEWLETRPDYTEGDAATSSSTRAALTADDQQAGEYLRALEVVAERAKLITHQLPGLYPLLTQAVDDLAAVRAVKEKQGAAE